MRRRVSFFTLGCKLNQYETEALMEEFEGEGFEIVPFGEPADICIVNTCTVTSKSDYRSRQALRRARKVSPNSIVVATGCYAQREPDLLAGMGDVDLVVGIRRKDELIDIIRSYPDNSSKITGVSEDIPWRMDRLRVKTFREHTRAFLKIQDGCDRNCSYCAVRLVRGPSRSKELGQVVAEAISLRDMGYREISLTGVHIGDYGLDLGGVDLLSLMEALEGVDGELRFRLSSLDPIEVSPDVISFLKRSRKFCRHVHLSIQSGNDRILRLMNRPYSRSDIADAVTQLYREIPGVAIGADFIVGFPTEGEEDFLDTCRLVEELPFSYLHVFRFSPREGTAASAMDGQIPSGIKKERSARLIELGKDKRKEFISSFIGGELEAIIVSKDPREGTLSGLTDNYIKVICDDNPRVAEGMLSKVKIERVLDFKRAYGRIAGDEVLNREKG